MNTPSLAFDVVELQLKLGGTTMSWAAALGHQDEKSRTTSSDHLFQSDKRLPLLYVIADQLGDVVLQMKSEPYFFQVSFNRAFKVGKNCL